MDPIPAVSWSAGSEAPSSWVAFGLHMDLRAEEVQFWYAALLEPGACASLAVTHQANLPERRVSVCSNASKQANGR